MNLCAQRFEGKLYLKISANCMGRMKTCAPKTTSSRQTNYFMNNNKLF